jgi:branched-chain amino acid transport system substrate-binding protein
MEGENLGTRTEWTVDRRSVLKGLGAGGITGLAGCTQGVGGGEDTIQMGGILPLTGGLADPAQWIERGWTIRVNQVNDEGGLLGRDVELTVYDTELDNQKMQTLTSRLITQDEIDVFLGPYPTITAPVISPILNREGFTVLHMFWPYSQILAYREGEGQWPNQFGFNAGTLNYPEVFIEYLDSLSGDVRPERIALLGRNDIYGEDASAAFHQFVDETDDMEIVFDQYFEVGSTDLAPAVRPIQDADADVIACNSYMGGSQLFIQAVADVGLHPDFLWANVGPQIPSWIPALESTGEYVLGSTPYAYSVPTDANEQLFQVAQDEYGSLPHYSFGFSAIQFDIYRQAIEEVGEIDQEAIADAWREGTFESVTGGGLEFEDNYIGDNGPMFMTQVQDEELPIVYPPDSQTADPVVPLPDEWPNQEWP